MDILINRFDNLSVGINPPRLHIPQYESISDKLKSHYKEFSLHSNFGSKSLNYLCELSTRYASATFKTTDERALMAYSLWLSLIWMIDGIFDKFKSRTINTDVETLIAIFKSDDIDVAGHPLFEPVDIIYKKYLDIIEPYRKRNPIAYSNIVSWLVLYLKTLLPIESTDNPIENNVKENDMGRAPPDNGLTVSDYTAWRLDSGAMMCVVWHIIMFESINQNLKEFDVIFKVVAIIVSFHNDVISYHRDLQQGTPNIVSVLNGYINDHFNAMKDAIQLTDRLYSIAKNELQKLMISNKEQCEIVGPRLYDILEGSYSWSYAEARYQIGNTMLRSVINNNDKLFYRLLNNDDHTPGDPQSKDESTITDH